MSRLYKYTAALSPNRLLFIKQSGARIDLPPKGINICNDPGIEFLGGRACLKSWRIFS
jgi:hypothetical protein